MNRNEKEARRYYDSTIKEIEELEEAYDSYDDEKIEEKEEEFRNSILSIDKRIVYKISLSTGGPSDGFKITIDPETKEVIDIVYWYADWGYYEEFQLDEDIKRFLVGFFSYLWEG